MLAWMKPLTLSLLLMLGCALGAHAIDNLLENADFDNEVEGWSLSAMNGNELLPVDDGSGVVGCCAWAKIEDVGPNAWNPEIHSPPFNVKEGPVYTMAFWAKTEPGMTRTLQVKFEQLDTWVGPGTDIEITDEWAEYSFSPEMTMGSPPEVVVHVGFNLTKEDVWLDHFRVYEGDFVEEVLTAVEPEDKLATSWAALKQH